MRQLLARLAIALTKKGRRDASGSEGALEIHDLTIAIVEQNTKRVKVIVKTMRRDDKLR
jgi:hypothetical protein